MLNAIIRFSVRNKLIVGLFTLALIVWGIIDLRNLPVDALPDITSNQVQIITSAPSQSALDIERFVTFPIEQTMATIPEIVEFNIGHNIISRSVFVGLNQAVREMIEAI